MWQSEGESDMNAKWLQSDAAKKERAEAAAREKALRFAAVSRRFYTFVLLSNILVTAIIFTYLYVSLLHVASSNRHNAQEL
jgi:hypothetical protein